jgi:hypothetical protein
MTAVGTLWDLEERFWTQGADSARHATAKGAVFVLPYPAGILQGDALWREKDVAQRWRSVGMSERYLSRQKRNCRVGLSCLCRTWVASRSMRRFVHQAT